jgi:ElaA protein
MLKWRQKNLMVEPQLSCDVYMPMKILNWYWKSFTEIATEEMHELLSLRQQIFVVEQQCAYLDADSLDPCAWHLLGRAVSGQLVAYARLTFPGTRYTEPSFGRVLVVPSERQQGLGRALVSKCIERSKLEYPGQDIRISAQTSRSDLYQKQGFEVIGQPYDDVGIEHCDMVWHHPNDN